MVNHEMFVTNPDGSKSPIKRETVADSKKTLGIYDSPAGGNADHLSYIKNKAGVWVQKMQNGISPAISLGQHTSTNCGPAYVMA